MSDEEEHRRLAELLAHPERPGLTRLRSVSERLLGTPYKEHAVGDGAGTAIDPRPILDLDEVDCQTFVELAVACSRAGTPGEVEDEVIAMRYRRRPVDYFHRNHFLLEEWLPHNEARGLVREVSAQVCAGVAGATSRRRCDRRAWMRDEGAAVLDARGRGELHRRLAARPDRPSTLETEVPYVPLAAVLSRVGGKARWSEGVEERLREELLVVLVSPARVHFGLTFRGPDGWILRHATQFASKVHDHRLLDHLAYLHAFSRVVGLKLFALAPPTAVLGAGVPSRLATRRRMA